VRLLKGRGQPVLYLDFDGVLMHENVLWHPRRGAYLVAPEGYRLFQHASLLDEMLQPHPSIQVVLSTSWVRQYGCSGAAKRLPPGLRKRVGLPSTMAPMVGRTGPRPISCRRTRTRESALGSRRTNCAGGSRSWPNCTLCPNSLPSLLLAGDHDCLGNCYS
jgi:hypothetical protein